MRLPWRRRWESGRHELRRKMFRPLLGSPHLGPLEKMACVIELTMPTAVTLSVAYLLLTLALCLRVPVMLSSQGYAYIIPLGICHAIATFGLVIQLASPFLLSYLPWRFISCLFYFPYYACWKLFVALGDRPRTWVRTAREPLHHAR